VAFDKKTFPISSGNSIAALWNALEIREESG
jgi:hypothetical protein